MVQSILLAYGTAAVITAAYVHHYGVGTKPVSRLFGPGERFTLIVASAAVGALWAVFIPTLAVLLFRRARGASLDPHRARWRFLSDGPRHAGG